MFKQFFIAAGALSIVACSSEVDHSKMDHNIKAAANMGGVEVSGAFIKPPFAGRTTAAAFMTLENKGSATRLVSASSPISQRVEIHTHLHEDGVMKMRRIEGIDLAEGQTLQLKPGGFHLMMFDSVMPEDSIEAPLTLTYADGTHVTMIVPYGDEAPADVSHEGMNHDDMHEKNIDHSGH